MANTNIINAVFGSGICAVTTSAFRANYGMVLRFSGIDLPTAFEVDFSNYDVAGRDSITAIGQNGEVQIPDQLWDSGLNIYAYVYLHPTDDSGVTVYTVTIPVLGRPNRTDETPTPHEQTVIEQAISALNDAVEQTAADVASADASAQAAAQSEANASVSERAAAASASAALASQNAAESAAQSATESASGASESAQNAANSASAAAQSASSAASAAQNAASSATAAESSATDAETAKQDAQDAQTAAETAAESVSGLSEQIAQNTADIADLVQSKAGALIDTASGSIASFVPDATVPTVKGLTVDVEPVQDLHGYDSPWPAGGGKNKLGPLSAASIKALSASWAWNGNVGTANGLTLELILNTNNEYVDGFKINGTCTAASLVYILRNEASQYAGMILNGIPSGTVGNWEMYYALQTSPYTAWGYDLGNGVTLSDSAAGMSVLVLRLKQGKTFNNATIYPMIRPASVTDATFAPYSNICPISGWDSVNLWNDPKHGGTIRWNQLFPNPEDWQAHSVQTQLTLDDGVITATLKSGSPSVYAPAITLQGGTVITTVANHKYFASCQFKPATNGMPYLRNNTAFANSFVFGSNITPAGTWGDYANIMTATSTGGSAWYIGQGGETSSSAVGDSISIKNMMCIDLTEMFGAGNEPSTVEEFKALFPKDYYPYDGSYTETCVSAVNGDPYLKYTIQLGQTVYGGTLDAVNGVLTVDRAYAIVASVMNKQEDANGYYWYSTAFTLGIPAISGLNAELISDRFVKKRAISTGDEDGVITFYAKNIIRWKEKGDLTLAEYRTYLASNPFHVCYELATPITISLTPLEISVLTGQTNNIWSDSGNVSVEYAADLKTYINNKIAAAVAALS